MYIPDHQPFDICEEKKYITYDIASKPIGSPRSRPPIPRSRARQPFHRRHRLSDLGGFRQAAEQVGRRSLAAFLPSPSSSSSTARITILGIVQFRFDFIPSGRRGGESGNLGRCGRRRSRWKRSKERSRGNGSRSDAEQHRRRRRTASDRHLAAATTLLPTAASLSCPAPRSWPSARGQTTSSKSVGWLAIGGGRRELSPRAQTCGRRNSRLDRRRWGRHKGIALQHDYCLNTGKGRPSPEVVSRPRSEQDEPESRGGRQPDHGVTC